MFKKAATFYDHEQKKFVTFDCDLNYGFEELIESGLSKAFIDRLKTFLVKFNQLDLCKDEFILINLALLFSSDRTGLFNTNKINHYQVWQSWPSWWWWALIYYIV